MSEDVKEEKKRNVDLNNLKPLEIKKSKGKFKTFTNASIVTNTRLSTLS